MKSQDIVILLKIAILEEQFDQGLIEDPNCPNPFALRSLEAALGISKTEVSASLKRSYQANLATKRRNHPKVNRRNLVEFVHHGLKYAFPVKPGAPERGIATGFAAPMLKGQIVSAGADIYVWPYAEGQQRGLSVEPLFKSVPKASLNDERLYELLALIDAIRLGNQREANLAKAKFEQGIYRQ